MKSIVLKTVDEAFIEQLKNALDDDLEIKINSPGGDLYCAFEAYELIRNADKEVKVIVEGDCFSSATLILLAAKKDNREATKLSNFLIHSPILNYKGDINLSKCEKIGSDILIEYNKLKDIYKERLNIKEDEIDQLMRSETIINSENAVKFGFISNIKNYKNNKLMESNFVSRIIRKLLNEVQTVTTVEGEVIKVSELVVGAETDKQEGVYVLSTGEVITIQDGKIIDIITPKEEVVEEEVVVEEVKEEIKEEVKEEVVEEVVEEVKEGVVELEVGISKEEIKEMIKEAIEALKEEFSNKKPMQNKEAKKDFTSITKVNEMINKEDRVNHYWK